MTEACARPHRWAGVNLGADRLIIIGHSRRRSRTRNPMKISPIRAWVIIGGYLLDIIFMDRMAADLDRLERTNRLLEDWTDDCAPPAGLRRV